jgi:hypothetical protein
MYPSFCDVDRMKRLKLPGNTFEFHSLVYNVVFWTGFDLSARSKTVRTLNRVNHRNGFFIELLLSLSCTHVAMM